MFHHPAAIVLALLPVAWAYSDSAAHRRSPAALIAAVYDWSMGVAAAQFEGQHMVSETWRRVLYRRRPWSCSGGQKEPALPGAR